MQDVSGVSSVHDLHIWTVTSGFVSLSAHVEVEQMDGWDEMLTDLTHMLGEQFSIAHVTLQPERSAHVSDTFVGCSLETEEGMNACRVAIGDANADAVRTRHGHVH